MTEVEAKKPQESLQDRLNQVVELLNKHKLVEDLAHRQEGQHQDLVENLVHRQNLAELQRKLDDLHPADIAHILESLPLGDRLTVWQLVKAERDGDILLEVSDAVRETLRRKHSVAATLGDRRPSMRDVSSSIPSEASLASRPGPSGSLLSVDEADQPTLSEDGDGPDHAPAAASRRTSGGLGRLARGSSLAALGSRIVGALRSSPQPPQQN